MDSHALIVGASSGIGEALARRMIAAGQRVTVMARRKERLDPLAASGALALTANVTDTEAVKSAIEFAVAENGLLASLVYCAGMQVIAPVRLMKAEALAQMIAVNLTAPLAIAGIFASKRISAPDAVFCAISSIAAERPEPGIVAYSATKAATDAMIRGLARELGPRRAVGVAPGWLDTEMTRRNSKLYDEAFRERLAASSPAGLASVESVVDTIEFLVSPRARVISGEVIRVDGGMAA